jgi:putative ABC transport system permease protein
MNSLRETFISGLDENLRMAFYSLRAHKGRSGLVILGVALGVTTLMAMVSIMEGFRNRLENEIMNTETTQIWLTSRDPFADHRDNERIRPLTYDDGMAIEEHCPSIREVDVMVNHGTVARYGGEKSRLVGVTGATTRYQTVNNDFIEEGRFFSEAEFAGSKYVCAISRQMADDTFNGLDPIGRSLRLDEDFDIEVVGIFQKRESIFGSLGQNYMVMPLTTYGKCFPWNEEQWGIIAVPEGNARLEQAKEEIEALMRLRHRLTPGKENDFHISTQDMAVQFTRQVTGPLTLVGVILASIGLMVGGIGVITIMLVSVKERTREIGIRMAVGGRRRDIMQLFLVEAATLTGLGGLAGVLAGLLIGQLIALLTPLTAAVPVLYVAGAVLVSAGTGIFFGLYPAVQASRLDPIAALSYE